jgi:DNA-binding NarL/FixJ family response regulator
MAFFRENYLRTANCSAEALITTLKRIRRGEYPINDYVWGKAIVASHLLRQFQDISLKGRAETEGPSPLNPKELKILTLIANGKSNRQISSYLGTTEQTVKNCVSAILRKLDANDRAHAVNIAVARGLVVLQREAPSYLPVSLSTPANREEKGVSHSHHKQSFSPNNN